MPQCIASPTPRVSQGDSPRRLLASAVLDMAAVAPERGESLPRRDPSVSDPDADIEEPIDLRLRASTSVETGRPRLSCLEPAGPHPALAIPRLHT